MATVRKRSWTAGGRTRTAFVVHYGSGEERGQETFDTKREADARRVEIERDLQRGAFKRINRDITLAEAAQQWLDHVRARGREPTTLAQYKSHLVRINRVAPALGKMKLAQVRKGHVANLFGALLKAGVSDATARDHHFGKRDPQLRRRA